MTRQIIVDGLAFPEAPRWHGGQLWFSDMHGDAVYSIDGAGALHNYANVTAPSGLGWSRDGELLIVSMQDRSLLSVTDGHQRVVADLSTVGRFLCNDMVVDAMGRSYVGNFGFDPQTESPIPTDLALVRPGAPAVVAASDLWFPNGMVIVDDGATLIVAESYGFRLTAFSIAADGTLGERRVFADLGSRIPDGICAGPEGSIWVACPFERELVRVVGGGIGLVIPLELMVTSCVIGDDVLYATSAPSIHRNECRRLLRGRIEAIPLEELQKWS